jgi:hypothetical protein
MHYPLFLVSIFLLLTISYDFFFSVISINGAGSISSRLSALISTVFLRLSCLSKSRKILKYSGAIVILSLIIWWIGGLWFGFYLLILSDDLSVVSASSGIMADVSDKFYYSGYVLSTMGNGDFVPGSSRWQIVIAVFSFSGFIFITTAMTYLISVSSAVIHKRSLALFITDIMVLDDYVDKVNCLNANAADLRSMINRHNQNHLAYPVVHYFFSMDKETSFSFGLWELNNLLLSIQNNSTYFPNKLKPLIHAVDNYLNTMSEAFIPRVQKDIKSEKVSLDDFRKQQLLKLLESDGWDLKHTVI